MERFICVVFCGAKQSNSSSFFVSMIDICFWYHFIGNFPDIFRPKKLCFSGTARITFNPPHEKFYSFSSIHIEKSSIHRKISPILFVFGWLVDNQLVAAHSKSCTFSRNYSDTSFS